jgi:hypothetical protein
MKTKFTATGPYHDEAFEHLRELGLREKAAESGANQLAQNIRDLLINPFKEASK